MTNTRSTMPIEKTREGSHIADDGAENKDILCNNNHEDSQSKGKRKTINNDDDEKGKEKIEERRNDKIKRKRTRVLKEPKKPKSAYILFTKTKKDEFSKKYPNATGKEIISSLGKAWKELSDEEKKPYVKMAQDEYDLSIKEYKKANKNVDNGKTEEKDALHEIDPLKPFVDFRSLLGSPISFGPFEANIGINDQLPDSTDIAETCVQKEIVSSESSLNIYQTKQTKEKPAIVDLSQQPQLSSLHNNIDTPFPYEEQNNVVPMQQPYQSSQQSQIKPQSNNSQFNLQTSRHQSRYLNSTTACQCDANLINSQLSQQNREQQVQGTAPSHQQIQVFQPPPQQPMHPTIPYASSQTMNMQQSIPFEPKLIYPNINCNNSHNMWNIPENFNYPPAQPYMPPPTQILQQQMMPSRPMTLQMSHQQMMCQQHVMESSHLGPSHKTWLPQMPPNFMQTRTNMPLQPSTCHNQMPLCSYYDPCHNMPFNRHPHQMQQTQTPMMNDRRPSDYVFYQQMEKNNMYQRNIYHQISQPMYTHQMNWRLK